VIERLLKEYLRLLGYPPGYELEAEARERAEGALDWYRRHGSPGVTVRVVDGEMLAAVTAGRELDDEVSRLWAQDRVDEAYFLDRLGAAVVEALASALGRRRSPGTGDVPFAEQFRIFAELSPPNMRILPSGMLEPKNSLLAAYAGDVADNPCARCNLPRCDFRRRAA
jgi:hypothetical protein